MTHPGHGFVACSCGNVVAQCRCMLAGKRLGSLPHPACGREPGSDLRRGVPPDVPITSTASFPRVVPPRDHTGAAS